MSQSKRGDEPTCVWIEEDASGRDACGSFERKEDVAGAAGGDLAPHPVLWVGHTARRSGCHARDQRRALERWVRAWQRSWGACTAGGLGTYQRNTDQQVIPHGEGERDHCLLWAIHRWRSWGTCCGVRLTNASPTFYLSHVFQTGQTPRKREMKNEPPVPGISLTTRVMSW